MIHINGNIQDITIGHQPIRNVYAGNDLVWQKEARQKPLILEYELTDHFTVILPFPDPVARTINWGDGHTEETSASEPTHTYENEGTYIVKVYGEIQTISSDSFLSSEIYTSQLRRILSWGDPSLRITSMKYAFSNYTGLTSVSADEYGAFGLVTDFSYCFWSCIALATIPAQLFAHASGATSFARCFRNCSLLSILPEGLFENCPDATDFSYCFTGAWALATIPENLFANCPEASDLYACFYDCKALTSLPESLFAHNPQIRYFNECFCDCKALTGETPKDPDGGELWERAGKEGYPGSISASYCFENCTGLSNYDKIPDNWK
ncbi:MAG: hypothetical protein LUF85_08500 [Bacteroides sp.]|nr:hypothetical protein [Bacteroides sp.]